MLIFDTDKKMLVSLFVRVIRILSIILKTFEIFSFLKEIIKKRERERGRENEREREGECLHLRF